MIQKKLGYNLNKAKVDAGDQGMIKQEEEEAPVDFKQEVTIVASKMPWKNAKKDCIKETNKKFAKYNKNYLMLANLILGNEGNDEIKDLYDIPYVKESKNKDDFILAILLQNA